MTTTAIIILGICICISIISFFVSNLYKIDEDKFDAEYKQGMDRYYKEQSVNHVAFISKRARNAANYKRNYHSKLLTDELRKKYPLTKETTILRGVGAGFALISFIDVMYLLGKDAK